MRTDAFDSSPDSIPVSRREKALFTIYRIGLERGCARSVSRNRVAVRQHLRLVFDTAALRQGGEMGMVADVGMSPRSIRPA